jgi:hypothetical protein
MTDALLETLTDQQLEAVFAHEVGHGVHRHLWWYAAGFIAATFFATGASEFVAPHLPAMILNYFDNPHHSDKSSLILSLLLLAPFLALGFPYISHRFEHQADYFAAKHMAMHLKSHPHSVPLPAAVLVTPLPETITFTDSSAPDLTPNPNLYLNPNPNPNPNPVVASVSSVSSVVSSPALAGAEIFISSLDTIVELAHRSRDKGGWMHPSINHRISLLRRLATDPLTQKRFARRMWRTRLYILLFLIASLALTALPYLRHAPAKEASATMTSFAQ